MKYTKEDLFALLARATEEKAENTFSAYLEMLDDIVPSHLYHYCTHDNKNMDLITEEQVQLCKPTSYNDPYDSYVLNSCAGRRKRKYDVDRTILAIFQNANTQDLRSALLRENILSSHISYAQKLEILKLLREEYEFGRKIKFDEAYHDTEEEGENKRLGDKIPYSLVGCFSESKDDILMWAHYAKSFTGICVEYKKQDILTSVRNREFFLVPVRYTEFPYAPNEFDQANYADDNLWNLLQFMHKSTKWEYELEWRIVKFQKDISKTAISLKGISNIYLGYKFEYFNKYAFHFLDDGTIEQDTEKSQIETFLKLVDFANANEIGITMTRPIERMYTYEVDESQRLHF